MKTQSGITLMEWIVVIAFVSLALIFATGCMTRTVTYGGATYKSTRFLMEEKFSDLKVKDTNGVVVELNGYASDSNAPELHLPYGVKVLPPKKSK